ncbi:MAG: ATP-binding protein [Desulfobaccales bacterium]
MEREYHKKLRWQIILTILAFSVIPLLILGAYIYYQFSQSYYTKIMEDMKTLAENRSSSIDLFLDERVSQLSSLAHIIPLDKLRDEANLEKVFDIIQARSKSYLDLGIIDQQGRHLAYVGPYYALMKSANYQNEDWFHKVMATGVYVSDVFLGFRKVPHFIIAVRVQEGSQSWILRATIDSDTIETMVRAAWVGKKGDAFLIDGNDILQTKPRFDGAVLQPAPGPDFSKASVPQAEEIALPGQEGLFAVGIVKLNKWVLVIREDPGDQLTPLLRTRSLMALIALGGVLLIAIGAVLATRSMMNEMTDMERKKAASEEMAMQESKMAALGKMAAGIAHEINNPLAVIGEKAGWIKDLLKMEDVSNNENFQEIDAAVNKIEYHVNRAKTITHRLLGFARRMEPVAETVDISAVLAESVAFLENEARHRQIGIKADYAPDLPKTASDPAQLQQVFLNILNNAIDAIGKDGEIHLQTRHLARNNEIGIEISDSGPGIPREMLTKIFDPFFTTKEVGKGTGLGLSISYSIVEKLGGRMLVASQEGQGTTFTIYFPVR